MNADREPGDVVKPDETLFQIVEAIQDLNGARVDELVEHTGFSKSTVYRNLATLEKHEYIVREGYSYNLSFRFPTFRDYVRQRHDIYKEIKPQVRKIAEQTEEVANFLVEEHGLGVFVFREHGSNAVYTDARIGMRMHLHHTAAGKAGLASLPEDVVHETLDKRGLPARRKTR